MPAKSAFIGRRRITQKPAHRTRWLATPERTGRNVPGDATERRQLCPVADRHMTVDAGRPANHDPISNGGAARDSDLGDDDAMSANADIVGNLHQIVDLGALADDRVVERPSVDCGVRADFNVILDDDPADLRDLFQTPRARSIAETILADAHTGMDDDIVADQRVLDCGSMADVTIPAYPCSRANGSARGNDRSRTDLGAGAMRTVRFVPDEDIDPFFEAVVQAAEEAILNSMIANEAMTGRDGNFVPALPQRAVKAALGLDD